MVQPISTSPLAIPEPFRRGDGADEGDETTAWKAICGDGHPVSGGEEDTTTGPFIRANRACLSGLSAPYGPGRSRELLEPPAAAALWTFVLCKR